MSTRKKSSASARTAPVSTSDLAADARNPRFMSDVSAAGLAASIEAFGDLSGIVWNKRTGQLVCGHQRLEQVHGKWGPQPIEIIDADRELGMIRIDDDHCFTVRVVDWPQEKQHAANVTANNPKIQGEFTGDVVAYIRDIETLLAGAALIDDVLLADLLDDFAANDPTQLIKIDVKPPPAMTWVLIGIATPRFGRIAETIDGLGRVPEIIIESTLNDG